MSGMIPADDVHHGVVRLLQAAQDGDESRPGISFTEVDIEHDPAAAKFVMRVNGGNQTVPTVKFADGTALTNPSLKEVKAKLASPEIWRVSRTRPVQSWRPRIR